jgi:hypothetical protein
MWWNPVRHAFCKTPEEWQWTNLHGLMSDLDEESKRKVQQFPAPQKLPGDDW